MASRTCPRARRTSPSSGNPTGRRPTSRRYTESRPHSRAACALRLTTCHPRSQIATDGDGDSQVTWTGLSAGTYLAQARPSLTYATTTVYLHDGYTLDSVLSPLSPYSVAGGQHITLNGTGLYESEHIKVRFIGTSPAQTTDVDGTVDPITGTISALTPAWVTPSDWRSGCADPAQPTTSATCVPDLSATVSFSLDDGATFSNAASITYGFVRQLKLAFIYVGPVTDFGWTYSHNKGRLSVESSFGGLVDAMTYFESEPEGEFEGGQDSRGMTIASGTAVNPTKADGSPNMYYSAFTKMKTLCDDDFDLVFSTSFGFMSQTLDVSTDYAPCRVAADGVTPHNTHFVHATGYKTNDLMSTMFGKIYQMRYLTGFVAGDALAAAKDSPFATPRNGKCVAYIAAYPIPEVQRGINAFTLGCRARFADCTVKVVWTGTWHSAKVEGAAAHFLWNAEGCDLVTQHSDTTEPQLVYKAYGGLGIGYNSDMREVVGDSVLTAPMLEWGPIFRNFVEQVATDSWVADQQAWPAAAEGAVKLMPTFSPKVDPATVQFVEHEHAKLKNAPGVEAFHHVFCGPLKKRWAYEFADPAAAAGPRQSGCGFNPVWRRLDEPEQLNLKHYRDKDGNPLPANRTVPLETDCLWGMDWPGQALLFTAFPYGDFNEDYVFSDYLVEGVELLQPRETEWGTVHDDTTHGCFTSYGTSGDRFFSPPPDPVYPTLPEDCAAGSTLKVGAEPSLTVCEECPAGTFEHQNLICQPASSGHYIPNPGSTIDDQVACQPNSMVQIFFAVSDELTRLQLGTGAATAAQCLCQEGFFVDADGACAACPDGAICHGAHFPPVAKRGYGQLALSNSSADFFECPNYELCLAGSSGCDCPGGSVNMKTGAVSAYTCDGAAGYADGSPLCGTCVEGFAKALYECNECTLSSGAYAVLSTLFVLLWFPLLRDLISRRVRSLYTTTSFVQYLGIYATFDIAWADGSSLKQLFVAFGFFNLSLDAVHLQCLLSWKEVWLLQAFLPLLYPVVYILFVVPTELGLSRARGKELTFGKAVGGMLSPLLFYLNMYYYTGIANSFEMLICSQDGDGGSYLVVNPTIKCWQGEHVSYAAVAVVAVVFYMVLLPAYYCYVFFVRLPKQGLDNADSLANYGFLYERFEPELWYWELIEIMRKFVFVLVAKLGITMDTAEATFIALIGVTIVLLSELMRHPFKSTAYDVVEEFTTLTEFVVLVLGIMALYRTQTGMDMVWIEPVAWVFIGISFIIIAVISIADVNTLLKLRWVDRLRTKASARLSPAIFDLQFCKYLLPRFVEQASPEQLAALNTVEERLAELINANKLSFAADDDHEYVALCKLAPGVADYLARGGELNARDMSGAISPEFVASVVAKSRSSFSQPCEKSPVKPGKAVCTSEPGTLNVPSALLFNDKLLGSVLTFMERKATVEELDKFAALFDAVQSFELSTRGQQQGAMGAAAHLLDMIGLRKHVHAKNRLLVDIVSGTHNKPKSQFKISLRPYSMDFGAMTATRRSSCDNIAPVIIAPKPFDDVACNPAASKDSANSEV